MGLLTKISERPLCWFCRQHRTGICNVLQLHCHWHMFRLKAQNRIRISRGFPNVFCRRDHRKTVPQARVTQRLLPAIRLSCAPNSLLPVMLSTRSTWSATGAIRRMGLNMLAVAVTGAKPTISETRRFARPGCCTPAS